MLSHRTDITLMFMNIITSRICVWLVLLLCSMTTVAKPLQVEQVPDALKPWVEWVSQGNEHKRCPFLFSGFEQFQCAWPGELKLTLDATGGQFSQRWQVYEDSWLLLPGEAQYWPMNVTVNGKSARVISRNGVPAIQATAGIHAVEGQFRWNALPKSLPLPPSTALLNLNLNGAPVSVPRLENSRLWLQAAQTQKVEDRFELQVFRRIDDTIPAQITLHLDMQVAGSAREIVLDIPLGENFIPLSLQSPLPARLDSGHSLRLQIKPGRWAAEVTMRHAGPLNELTFNQSTGNWVTQEVWVFNAVPQYRIVNASGLNAIDPQQTLLPEDWKRLPAYRVEPGQTMIITEERRGDPDPGADNLALQRQLWLSFAGNQYTLQDQISGVKKSAWRLEMNPPMELGRVTVDGNPQYITRLPDSERSGVEVRQGNLQLTADSVLRGDMGRLPAIGWNQAFNQVSTTLHIPPGYRVFSISGADSVSATWLNRWTLLDIFLVLLISAAVGKLWGRILGVIALLTLTLIYHEANAPVWIWLFVVLGFALLRVLPSGGFRRWALVYRNASLITLVLITVPFFIQQIRTSLYQQLEHYYQTAAPFDTSRTEPMDGGMPGMQRQLPRAAAPALKPGILLEQEPQIAAPMESAPEQSKFFSGRSVAPTKEYDKLSSLEVYDPNARLQTGPGLPQWRWNQVAFSWSGPVDANQTIRIIYINPFTNSLLGWLRVILVSVLILGILNVRLDKNAGVRLPSMQWFTSLVVFGLAGILFAGSAGDARAEFPSKAMLEELQKRLFAPPDCLPQCADIESMHIKLAPDSLTLELTVHSEQSVAIPLPGNAEHWTPQKIWLNDQAMQFLSRDSSGTLWFALPKGRHALRLQGALGTQDNVQLPLPLKPHRVSQSGTGWEIAGIHDDGSVDAQLQFTRLSRQSPGESGDTAEFNSSNLPPFVQVERTLTLGLDWRIQTRITRLSPPGTAIVLQVPLLPGESVTSEGVRTDNNSVLINMAANQHSTGWSSLLTVANQLTLGAAQTTQWTEIWNLDVSPIWHMQYQGIPVIQHQQGQRWLPQWRPWPGEQVTFDLSRPQGVAGKTTTIDYSRLSVNPGIRITNAELTLNLRSSQGGQHAIVLPEGSTLQEVKVDNTALPLRLQERTLQLPVKPGEQLFLISWQEPRGLQARFQSSALDLGSANVNHHIALNVPRDRMVLWVNGPAMGPAVLFWGVLIVFLLLSAGLAQLKNLTPVRYWQWALLSVGLVPVSVTSALVVFAWFFITGFRCQLQADTSKWPFNLYQLALVMFTLITAGTVVYAVSRGLLGSPDMQILGNGSSQYQLNWYQDMNVASPPSAWMFTIPMFIYRILMLLWALWFAFSVIEWSKWFWQCFSKHGYWRSINWKKQASPAKPQGSLPASGGGKYLAGKASEPSSGNPTNQ